MDLLRKNIIGILVYLALLFLSEQFTLFYEVQPVIWPVAAAFFTIILAYGPKALIGSTICLFIFFNFEIYQTDANTQFDFSLGISLTMTALSLIRVSILYALFKRFIGLKNISLYSPKHMIRFLIIAGPIGGLLGATLVIPAVLSAGRVDTFANIVLFTRWWIAMTTGGLLFSPVLLMMLLPKEANPLPRRVYLLSSFAAIILFFGMLWFIREEVASDIEKIDASISTKAQSTIEQYLLGVENITRSLSAAMRLKPEMTAEEFNNFAIQLSHGKQIRVNFLGYGPLLHDSQRASFEKETNCTINQISTGEVKPQLKREFYVPVRFIYPMGVFDASSCNDLLSEHERSVAINKTLLTKQSNITKPVELANKDLNQIFLVTPILDEHGESTGIVGAVISARQLTEHTMNQISNQKVKFSFGVVEDGKYKPFFEENSGLSEPFDSRIRINNLNMYGQDLQIQWQPLLTEMYSIYNWQLNLFSTIGTLAVLLLQYISYRLVILNVTVNTEVTKKTKELLQVNQEAEDALSTKSRFLANISHEIRTPLNAILGYAQLAKGDNYKEPVKSYVDKIWSSSEALLSLINDILDYSKIEAGKLQLNPGRFSVEEMSNRLTAIFSLQAESKNLDFDVKYQSIPGFDLYGDETRIQQILINLCSNAIKFTKDGSICIDLRIDEPIKHQANLIATVTDSGIGISEQEQQNVFKEFTQADSGTARKFGGTGLGLAISNTLAELLRGELSLRSKLGEGTSFTLSVPVTLKVAIQSEKPLIEKASSHTILIVDDNPVNLKVTEALLRKCGFEPFTADNGIEAINFVLQEKPDIVLMDMQMPEMDGLETTQQIREKYSEQELIIIGLTANATVEDRENCLAAGMNDHLAKPASMEKLTQTLAKWI